MTGDNVFGSDQLTPNLLRAASFSEHDGRYDAAEVRTFLDRVASSLEVFMSADAPTALRAEFARNAEIAQQVLDAGQAASAQLRQQATEDAQRVLGEATQLAQAMRQEVDADLARAREQVDAMRTEFVRELRDLYDRIGASLYRFDTVVQEQLESPTIEPAHSSEPSPTPPPAAVAPGVPPPPAPAPPVEEAPPAPAYQQLPPEAWQAASPAQQEHSSEPAADPFAVVEDEPLAPGEPLIDLSGTEFQQTPELAAAPASTDVAQTADAPPEPVSAPEPAPAPAHEPPPAPEPAAEPGGSWLDAVTEEPAAPAVQHDDALAEALIAGSPFEDASGNEPVPPPVYSPPTVPPPPAPVDASPDAAAIRQLILDALAAGQTRDAIEAYLSEELGLMEPGVLIDAALGTSS